jgi:uncharacterized membrane protein AbrB (regulator of aidB expression)
MDEAKAILPQLAYMLKRHAVLYMVALGLVCIGLAWYELRQVACGASFCGQTAVGYSCTSNNQCSIAHPELVLVMAIVGLTLFSGSVVPFVMRKMSQK